MRERGQPQRSTGALPALDRIAPAKLAIPLGFVTAGGLVFLGLSHPTIALFAGIVLLAVALALSLSARWRLEGDPDPVTAGVDFEAPDQPAARWIGWACVLLGGAVLGFGVWDTAQTRLTTGWDPMRGALAATVSAPRSEGREERPGKPTDAMLKALKRQRDDLRAAAAASKTESKIQEPDKAPWGGRRERPVVRVGADGQVLPEVPEDDAVVTYDGLVERARKKIAYGEDAQAIGLLNKAAKVEPGDRRAFEMLCSAYERVGEREAALKACEDALSQSGDGPHVPVLEKKIRALRAR